MLSLLFKISFFPRFVRQIFYTYFNRLMFWSAGAKIEKDMLIRNRFYLKLYEGGKLIIGKKFIAWSGESINPISRNLRCSIFVNTKASLTIGNNVGISSTCIWTDKSIFIGNNVKIGANCTIIDTDCHSLNYLNRRKIHLDRNDTKSRPIVIEDDVLIGAHSIVLKGVHIGRRTIIGAGSVVTNNIPNDCIAAGNPCRIIRVLTN